MATRQGGHHHHVNKLVDISCCSPPPPARTSSSLLSVSSVPSSALDFCFCRHPTPCPCPLFVCCIALPSSPPLHDTLHQQMPILHVTYTSQEMQSVAGFTSDDIIINTTPTCNSLGNGSALPQIRSSNGGGRGGGGGNGFSGFSGGNFGGGGGLLYNHKGNPIELALSDDLHLPSSFAELQNRRRVCSRKEKDDVDMKNGDSKVAAARMPGVRVHVELVGSEDDFL